jgi:hypothetical protein
VTEAGSRGYEPAGLEPAGRPGAGSRDSASGGAGAAFRAARRGPGPLEVGAVILLLAGGLLVGIGWIVGVVLLWSSPHWRTRDKLLGTLIWPGGIAGAALVLALGAIATSAGTAALAIAAVLAVIVQLLLGIWLLRRAGQNAAAAVPEPATLQPV